MREKNNFHSTSGPKASERGRASSPGWSQLNPALPARPATQLGSAVSRGPPSCGVCRPAGAPESGGRRARRGGAASRGGGAEGWGRAGAGGRRARPEGGCERAGGRRGPGAAGQERRRRHVRQREAQPGLHHRAPAGRWAGIGKGRAHHPRARRCPEVARGRACGSRGPASLGRGQAVRFRGPWTRPPPRPRAAALEWAPGSGPHAWPGLRVRGRRS